MRYESSSSSRSSVSSEEEADRSRSNDNHQKTDENQNKEEKRFADAVADIENDLNNLAGAINEASQISEEQTHELPKKPTFDEDDDTSKQATQNYDLHDNEQEVQYFSFAYIYYFTRSC